MSELSGRCGKLVLKPCVFRRIAGIDADDFIKLHAALLPKFQAFEYKRLYKPDRKRKFGGGNQYKLAFCDQLLMLLIYYRHYTSYSFLTFLFGMNESNICRLFAKLEPLMAAHFRIPERKIKLDE